MIFQKTKMNKLNKPTTHRHEVQSARLLFPPPEIVPFLKMLAKNIFHNHHHLCKNTPLDHMDIPNRSRMPFQFSCKNSYSKRGNKARITQIMSSSYRGKMTLSPLYKGNMMNTNWDTTHRPRTLCLITGKNIMRTTKRSRSSPFR